jgi:hypothetical protein
MLVPLNEPVVIEDEKKEPEPYLLWLPESSRYPSQDISRHWAENSQSISLPFRSDSRTK